MEEVLADGKFYDTLAAMKCLKANRAALSLLRLPGSPRPFGVEVDLTQAAHDSTIHGNLAH